MKETVRLAKIALHHIENVDYNHIIAGRFKEACETAVSIMMIEDYIIKETRI
jgi:hypothetical protein